jgi:hypothetical protein
LENQAKSERLRSGIPATRGGSDIGADAVDLIDLELLLNVMGLPGSLPLNRARRGIIMQSKRGKVIFCPWHHEQQFCQNLF